MRTAALLVILAAAGLPAFGQDVPGASTGKLQVLLPLRWYEAPAIAPIHLANSNRLYTLIRAGNLYLTAQDAVALAIENNLGLEVDRYGPLLAQTALDRSRAGGPLRGVPSGSSQITAVNAGVGVNGSAASAGLGGNGGGGGGGTAGNSTIQQVGEVAPNFDPVMQSAVNFSHLTYPQANTVLSQTEALIDSIRQYNTTLQEGTITGGAFQYRDYEQHLLENSPTDILNPVAAPRMDLIYSQNWLQGFGIALNNRFIRVAQINVAASREQFRAQLANLVTSVLNLYWDYVAADDELKLRQRALDITEKFRDDTKYEISVGAIAGVELPRAEAEVAGRRQDLTIAQATLRQRAIVLKEALSHTEDPALEAAQILPMDRIDVPDTEDVAPLHELIAEAMAKRPDVAVANYQDQTQAISLVGTANPLLPRLQTTFQTYDRGVAGTPQLSGGEPNAYFAGGYGSALGQVFRRDFPNNRAVATIFARVENRQAQGDYGIDQLQYRQSQVSRQRDRNQVAVDVSNEASSLREARARYETAKNTRTLQVQLLEAEQKRSYGPETFNYIMADQRALIAAQLSEMNAAAAYMRARVGLDAVLGETLERNRITLDEGLAGRVARPSGTAAVPPSAPGAANLAPGDRRR